VEDEFGLVVNKNLVLVLHKSSAGLFDVLGHGSTEHHDLFVLRGFFENILNFLTHVQLQKHLVALVQNKELQVRKVKRLSVNQVQYTTRRSHHNLKKINKKKKKIKKIKKKIKIKIKF